MHQQELKQTIESVLANSSTGIMATVKDNKPHARYMTFFNENFTLYTPTNKETDKTEEVEENPQAHILLGYEGEGIGDTYVEYEGKVTIKSDNELKNKIWNDDMKNWFDGPNDPNLVILEIQPTQIHLKNKKGDGTKTLELS